MGRPFGSGKKYNKTRETSTITTFTIRRKDAKYIRSVMAFMGIDYPTLFHMILPSIYRFYHNYMVEGDIKTPEDFANIYKLALSKPLTEEEIAAVKQAPPSKPEQIQEAAQTAEVSQS